MNERPLIAGVLGALVIAFSAILVRLAEVSPSTAAVFRCAYALPVLGVLAWIERRRFGPLGRRDHLLALGAGVFFAADLTFWHHSIDAVGAGLATVIANTQVVLVALLAWVALGERPDPQLARLDPCGARRRGPDLRGHRRRRLRRRPGAGSDLRGAHGDHLRALPAHPAPGELGPAPARGAALRRHAERRGVLRAGRAGRGRPRLGPGPGGAGLARAPRALLAGGGLAADLGVAAAPPGGASPPSCSPSSR